MHCGKELIEKKIEFQINIAGFTDGQWDDVECTDPTAGGYSGFPYVCQHML